MSNSLKRALGIEERIRLQSKFEHYQFRIKLSHFCQDKIVHGLTINIILIQFKSIIVEYKLIEKEEHFLLQCMIDSLGILRRLLLNNKSMKMQNKNLNP